ncbi:hypothetical protein ACUXZZ_45260 (plasmid) [Streptomyces graminifolii]|uniref:hypothetical protein n=1 Tax=Streptomyces graminifolii TaxID=1266771 RepID=UPI004057DF23
MTYELPTGPPFTCPWLVSAFTAQCGLWYGHDGPHIPYEPGDYLDLPQLHPLDILPIQMHGLYSIRFFHCPLCGTRTNQISWDAPTLNVRHLLDEAVASVTWRFGPCGCEGRELLLNPHRDPASPT